MGFLPREAYYLLSTLLFVHALAISTELSAVLTEKESQITLIATTTNELLTIPGETGCEWTDGCLINPFPLSSTCDERFGYDTRCSCNASVVDFLHSLLSVAPYALSGESLESAICQSTDLDLDFMDMWNKDSSLRWLYVGFAAGFTRRYPFVTLSRTAVDSTCTSDCCMEPSSTCAEYDPRQRPWYSAAASGPREIVYLLDISYSMAIESRLSIGIQTIELMLNTLSSSDLFNVIIFADEAEYLDSDHEGVIRANTTNVDSFISKLKSVHAHGLSNYSCGFRKAFEALGTTGRVNGSCSSSIVFLSDGMRTDTEVFLSVLNESVNLHTGDGSDRFSIHTLALGPTSDSALLHTVSCMFNGLHRRVMNTDEDAVSVITALSEYFAVGMSVDIPTWTEPYTDALGLGEMTTVTLPVYDGDGKFKGVAGIDVIWENLLVGNDTEEEILEELLLRSSTCPEFSASVCGIESIRGSNFHCGLCPSIYPAQTPFDFDLFFICTGIVLVFSVFAWIYLTDRRDQAQSKKK